MPSSKFMRFLLTAVIAMAGCYPTPGPDKTVAGAVLGAGWGAGAGAIVGNQVGDPGPGSAIGAGFGAASGALTGAGFDIAEGSELEAQKKVDALKVQVASNQRRLMMLQDSLDSRDEKLHSSTISERVFFDEGVASLRSGAAVELQRFAEMVKLNPYVGRLQIHGHSAESQSSSRDVALSEARARTVATFLATHGVSLDQLELFAHGSARPLASNKTDSGRQLNRRVEIVLLK